MKHLLQSIYSLIRCPFNHPWHVTRDDDTTLEQTCQKCGKRVTRSREIL